ncbi:MAG: hypothetical protein MZW92_56025 [Comamonadaceae bacterium]|nr:hypothetical protein [Comamonadaceae bacterium]
MRAAAEHAATSASSQPADRGRGRARCSRAARCSSRWSFPADFIARLLRGETAGAGRARPTPPTRRPPAPRWPRWQRCRRWRCARDLRGPLARLRAGRGAVRGARAPALQPGGHHRLQRRARADGRDPDDDAGHDDRDGA